MSALVQRDFSLFFFPESLTLDFFDLDWTSILGVYSKLDNFLNVSLHLSSIWGFYKSCFLLRFFSS